METKLLILFIIFTVFFISCEKDMKWINEVDKNADLAEMTKMCEANKAECGSVEVEYNGKKTFVFCGKCNDGYECGSNYKCADIDECADSTLNDCRENADCHNLDTKSDGKPYECICKKNYSGDDCDPDTRTKECVDLPENAQWNTVSEITQTWDIDEWIPSNKGSFNEEASNTECRFKCNEHYNWNDSTNKCDAATQSATCTDLPSNAQWNTAESITQTWSGTEWLPTTSGSFSETASTTECRFKCKTNYNWNSSSKTCDAATQKEDCSPKPDNTVWNDSGASGTFTQTWNGEAWNPASYASTYSKTAGVCRYKCDDTHYWYDSECTSPCDHDPCEEIANSTHICKATSWNDYTCECNDGYFWNGSECKKQSNICTGQDKCYSYTEEITCPTSSSADFYGQDVQYTNKCTAQSFSSTSNVVIDNNTGLTWEKSPSSDTYTWDDAPSHCAELNSSNYGGKNNWRVPNPLELLTIVDNSRYNPATNSNFTNMPTSLWTSKEYKRNTSYAYAFKPYYGYYFGYDSTSYYSKTQTYKVLCVSGDEMQPTTSANFTTHTISGKDLVTDSKTGLMWQKEYVTGTWKQALKYCEDSTYAGYSDWRLPNKNELSSLINYEKSGAPYSYFPDMPSKWFWSSSTVVYKTNRAWLVHFYYGGVSYDLKDANQNVRCVRNADQCTVS